MKKRIISMLIALCICIGLFFGFTPKAFAAKNASEITQQIKNTYSEAVKQYGGSFNGYCNKYVDYQLKILGIDNSMIGYNGNGYWDYYKGKTKTSGGYNINTYPASSYNIKQALNAITSNGTVNAYNIMLGFQIGYDGGNAGHVMFIHAIINGKVYFSESYGCNYDGTYYAEGAPTTISIDTFHNFYTKHYGFEGMIHFTTGSSGGSQTQYYYLDVNWTLDGVVSDNSAKFATCDVYINGSRVADDVSDYYVMWPTGTQYEVRDIKTASGYYYDGPSSRSGTVGNDYTSVWLSIGTQSTEPAYISADYKDLYLDVDTNPSKTVTITAGGNLPDLYYFRYDTDNCSFVSCYWNGWVGSTDSLTITATEGGSGTLWVYLIDKTNNDAIIYTIGINVYATEPYVSPYISSNYNNLFLDVDTNPSATVTITTGGNLPGGYHLRYDTENCPLVSCTWGDWVGNTCALTITVTNGGSGTLWVYLIDETANNAIIDTIGINVYSTWSTPAYLTADSDNVYIELDYEVDINPTKTVTFTTHGNLPSRYSIRYDTEYCSFVSCNWNGWVGNTDSLTITATKNGSGTLYVYLIDTTDNDAILDAIAINVEARYIISYAELNWLPNQLDLQPGTSETVWVSATAYLNTEYQFLWESSDTNVVYGQWGGEENGEWPLTIYAENAGQATITVKLAEVESGLVWDGHKIKVNVQCNHNYRAKVTTPTCTAGGYTTYTCSICGDSYRDDDTPAMGHDWDDGVVTTKPTETKTGVRTYTCTRCGATKTETIPTFSHEHSYQSKVTAPTCTAQGYTTYTCSCGDSYRSDYTAALGHNWDNGVVTTKPTETKTGVRTYTCTRCGATKTETIPALNHEHSYRPKVTAPTCTAQGYTTYTCSCGDSYKSDYTAALGHNYVNGVCTRCGAKEEEQPGPDDFRFDDVQDPAKFYFVPVYWAFNAKPQITNGLDKTHFGPDAGCTRGQVVTFLWRAAGCPEPGSLETDFTDLKEDGFYRKAVAWAVEQGITMGMTATTFAPDATCTRGQIVTFLWRFRGEPAPGSEDTGFTDVDDVAFYAKAVAWAVENEVTNGMTATTFAPNATCTRGQIVTFLYRAMNG